jgi:hypothetical protein
MQARTGMKAVDAASIGTGKIEIRTETGIKTGKE